jgi:hypothetical protein
MFFLGCSVRCHGLLDAPQISNLTNVLAPYQLSTLKKLLNNAFPIPIVTNHVTQSPSEIYYFLPT